MKLLTTKQVIKRMSSGDLPCTRGGYTDSVGFDDGAIAGHKTMRGLVLRGVVERPIGTSIHERWKYIDQKNVARQIENNVWEHPTTKQIITRNAMGEYIMDRGRGIWDSYASLENAVNNVGARIF